MLFRQNGTTSYADPTVGCLQVWKDKHAEKKELLDEQYDWIESDLRNVRFHSCSFDMSSMK